MHIRLIKKYARVLNGVDLTHYRVGDAFSCHDPIGRMLILEGWAEAVPDSAASDDRDDEEIDEKRA